MNDLQIASVCHAPMYITANVSLN